MSIGENIKKYRKKQGYTQETLAEKLNVSVSAVSQWENGKNIPDITLISTLCHLFRISADVLLDINLQDNNREIETILSEAEKFSSRGKCEEAEKILSKGLLRYPNSYPIMSALMFVYYRIYLQGDKKEKLYEELVISLCNQIMDGCDDGEFRAGAVQILCYLYADKKDFAKAKELAYQMPTMASCRESLLTSVTTGEEKIQYRKSEFFMLLQHMGVLLTCMGMGSTGGENEYSLDERACLREKLISMFKLMFENEDYGFFHEMLSRVCVLQAEYFSVKKDKQKALAYLDESKEHAIAFQSYSPNEKHTSLIFRDMEYGDYITDSEKKQAANILEIALQERFDFLKNETRYQDLIAELKMEAE